MAQEPVNPLEDPELLEMLEQSAQSLAAWHALPEEEKRQVRELFSRPDIVSAMDEVDHKLKLVEESLMDLLRTEGVNPETVLALKELQITMVWLRAQRIYEERNPQDEGTT